MHLCDLLNMLAMIDESLEKIIEHLEKNYPDRALMRARETHKNVSKLQDHFGAVDNGRVVKKI